MTGSAVRCAVDHSAPAERLIHHRGVIDLFYRDRDGLVIVDSRTDAGPATALDSRMNCYRPQMAAYALAVIAATGETVARAVLLFLSPGGAHEGHIGDLAAASAKVHEAVLTARQAVGVAGYSTVSLAASAA